LIHSIGSKHIKTYFFVFAGRVCCPSDIISAGILYKVYFSHHTVQKDVTPGATEMGSAKGDAALQMRGLSEPQNTFPYHSK